MICTSHYDIYIDELVLSNTDLEGVRAYRPGKRRPPGLARAQINAFQGLSAEDVQDIITEGCRMGKLECIRRASPAPGAAPGPGVPLPEGSS